MVFLMDNISVVFKNEMMIYELYFFDEFFFIVKMVFGWFGSGFIVNLFMAMFCRKM